MKRPTSDELEALAEQAQEGDEQALARLRKIYEGADTLKAMVLRPTVRRALAGAAVGENPMYVETCLHEADILQKQLAGPDPSPLEQILAERVVACWLAVQHADVIAARFIGGSGSFAQGDFYRRWQDSAHKRFLAACRTLATVRRLALPVLLSQVNVVQQQRIDIAAEDKSTM